MPDHSGFHVSQEAAAAIIPKYLYLLLSVPTGEEEIFED